jgi:hypothetical protein
VKLVTEDTSFHICDSTSRKHEKNLRKFIADILSILMDLTSQGLIILSKVFAGTNFAVYEVWQKSNETSNTASYRPHRICSSRTNCRPSFFYKVVLERLRKRVIRVRLDIADKWTLETS